MLKKSVDRYMITAVRSCLTFVCDEMPSSCFPFRRGAGGTVFQHEGCYWSSLLVEVGGACPPPKKVPLWRGASAWNRGYLDLSRNSALQLPPLILSSLSKPQLASLALGTPRLWGLWKAPPPHEEWRGRGSSWMIQCTSVYSKQGLLRHSHANNHY